MNSRLDKLELITTVLVCAAVVAGISSGLGNNPRLLIWIREDGPVEWLTVIGLLLCVLICFLRAVLLREPRPTLFRWTAVLFGMAFLFGVGEEISWGQRLFGLQTPEWFAKHNRQSEINLHNLVVYGFDLTKLVFGKLLTLALATYLLVLPLAYLRNRGFRKFADLCGVPVARPRQALLFLILTAAILIPEIRGRESELFEFAAVFLVFLIFLNPLNRTVFNRHAG